MSDGIIGSVGVSIVPDASNFWRDFEAKTRAGATQAGRNVGKGVREGIQEELGKPVDVKVNADTARARAEIASLSRTSKDATFQAHLLRDAIILLGPAAVPIAGVLSGAFIGAVPAAATLLLGIKGIQDEMKSGALVGTQYASDFSQLSAEATALKQAAAGGLLGGIDQGLQGAHPLFRALNAEIGVMSAQIGGIVAHAGPGLLNLFTELDPLFTTFGNLLVSGATHFEHWTASTTGVRSFVAYVQTELPTVIHELDALFTAAVHLAAGLSPIGLVALRSIGLLSSAINLIPVRDLANVETVLVAGYAAWRTYGAVSAAAAALSTRSAAKVVAAAEAERLADLSRVASSKQVAAAKAQEAAVVAEANLAEARAAEESATQQLVAATGTQGADRESALIAVQAAQERVAAMQRVAAVAVTTAEVEGAAATAAADTVRAEGAVASLGWKAALGPVAALAVGVSLLTSVFTGNHDGAQAAAEAANSYGESVKSSTDALSSANIAQTNKNLSDKGAITALSKLAAGTKDLGLTNVGLALAVNGTQDQYDKVIAKLKQYQEAYLAAGAAAGKGSFGGEVDPSLIENAKNAQNLIGILATERKGLQDQILTQTQLNQLNAATLNISNDQAATGAALYGLVGTKGVAAYLAATQAAQSSTDQTKQQTLAWQLANDAGNLLQQTLDKLSGKTLSYAQANNAFEQQLVSLVKKVKGSDAALTGMSQSAIQNRGNILSLIQGAEGAASAYGQLTGSSEKGREKLIALRQEIIDNAVAHGIDKQAVTDYINTVLRIPKSVPPTKLELDTAAALAAFKALKVAIHDATVYVHLQSASGGQGNANIVRQITGGFADGGSVGDGWFTVGERGYELGYKQGSQVQVFSNAQSQKMTGQASVPGYASGTGSDIVTLNPSKSKKKAASGPSAAARLFAATKLGQAAAALTVAADSSSSTFAQLKSAANALDSAAVAQKISAGSLKVVLAAQSKLLAAASQRDKVRAALGTAPTAPTAYDKLATALNNFNQEKSSVASAFGGLLNVSTVGASPYSDQPGVSGTSILAGITGNANQAQTEAGQLAKLKAEHLNAGLLSQFANNPSGSAAQIAALASASQSTINAINVQYGRLGQYGSQAGTTAATSLYGAGLSAAQGIVNGLKSQEGLLSKEIAHYADLIEKGIKGPLGIKSPSTVGHSIGVFFGAGVVNGLVAQHRSIRSAAAGIADLIGAGATPNGTLSGASRVGPGGDHYHAHGIQDPSAFLADVERRQWLRSLV